MTLNQRLKNLYAEQYAEWEFARKNIDDLKKVETRTFTFAGFEIKAQYNPARIISSNAQTDEKSIRERPCFLCKTNRPKEQKSIVYHHDYEILINPFPILPYHFTIARREHAPQEILPYFSDMLDLAKDLDEFIILYNGAAAGASAPDHMHFQAVENGELRIENGELPERQVSFSTNSQLSILNSQFYLRCCIIIKSKTKENAVESFKNLMENGELSVENDTCLSGNFPFSTLNSQLINVFCRYENDTWITFIFPRAKHRPTQYFAQGEDNMMISPGAIDMAGILVMPQKKDFLRLNKGIIKDVFRQVTKDVGEPMVSVGIMNESDISFGFIGEYHVIVNGEWRMVENGGWKAEICHSPSGNSQFSILNSQFNNQLFDEIVFFPLQKDSCFELKNVTIGINFHWERKEDQRFAGALKFIVEKGKITAINILPVEKYLKSVISSEMSASASLELLKAHAVISRSWLLVENGKLKMESCLTDDSHFPLSTFHFQLKWYERDAHQHFDVCADDHCQRYQGITRTDTTAAIRAVEETSGEVLMSDGKICDARFSKSCGGMTEKFENCWADVPHSYLTNIVDNEEIEEKLDLTIEENAEKWICQSPSAFCNTKDKKILSQVLNNYDRETTDFYRWKREFSQQELSDLVYRRSGIDFGEITDLIPVQRGASGRLVKLKIVGTKRTVIVGKELEIRKWLSESHLYSSAFVVERYGDRFILHGAGWGHGVGLCQIGAAVMGECGYRYEEILAHYYQGSELKKMY